ncbi:uncharacterized protein LOC132754046 [Ruditapes philippinarum]|uniref:uncharacterized protein LOC132754046 n=1 Tax=Ruditapes philippinarum TaxID=129788 RepID=UPI00295B414E|nr:uncharacterized protein LOC132754046 [Ruditapes philippinarum]
MALEEQTKNQNYKLWFRGCLGFKNLREGLAETVDTIVKNQHEDFVKNLTCTECDKCSLKTLLPNHVKVSNKCTKGRTKCFCIMHSKNGMSCPNSFCGSVYDSIVDDYLFSEPNWSNTDLAKWGHSYFEIAKCYIGSSGYMDKHTIEEVDCSALINIIINNRAFERLFRKAAQDPSALFIQARDDRNYLFHSPNLELSDDKLKSMTDNMMNLLTLPGIIDTEGKVQQSRENILQIRDGNIGVSTRDEIDVQEEIMKELNLRNQEAFQEKIQKSKQEVLDQLSCLKEHCEAKVNDIVDKQKTTEADLAQIRAELKKHCEMVDSNCKDLDCKQKESVSSLANLLAYVKTLDSRFGGYEANQTAIENKISELNQTIDTHLVVKLDKENERSMLDDASAKLRKRYEYTQNKEGLQKRLCDHYKKCLSTIPVSPVLEAISGTVDEVFVEFSINTNLSCKEKVDELDQVNLYREILFKNDKLCKNVYLLGEAGMGKTTWCKKFLNTWVNACNKNRGSDRLPLEPSAKQTTGSRETHIDEGDDDICCLKQFDILFYVALRRESQHDLIIDMIKRHPIVTEFRFQTVVEDILRYESESCIILLDGLDEWEIDNDVAIPSREGLHGCTVLTTSRKYRTVGIDKIDNAFYPDKVVEMSGVRNKEQLIKNVIRQLNTVMRKGNKKQDHDSSEEDCKQFIREAKEMKDRDISFQQRLPGYMDIPLLLIITICVWFDKGKIEDTLYKNMCGIVEFMIRYGEGFTQGVYKKKNRCSGKLEGIENLNEQKKEWIKHVQTLPSQFRNNDVIVPYSGLISKLSKFAFDTLFNAEHRRRLTFSHTELNKFFSDIELHVIMKLGLLSQSEVTELSLCPMTSLSFIHNAFHQFFAGMYLASSLQFLSLINRSTEVVNILADYYKDPVETNLLNMDSAILFACNINPVGGSKLSEMLFKELSPSEYNTHSNYVNDFCLRNVQVIHENDENYPSQEFPVYTEMISVSKNLIKGKMKYLSILLKTNVKHLTLVEVPCEAAHEILENFRDILPSDALTLCIYDVSPNAQCASVIKSLRCIPGLKNLELRGISRDSSEREQYVCFDLTNTVLKKLELKGFSNLKILVRNHTEVSCDDDTKYEIEIQNV